MLSGYQFFFFCSSRGRHTSYWRDWSSDVCSSDLECYPISLLRRGDHADPDLLTSCGTPVSMCSVRLLDEDGNDVPPGEIGEVSARSPAAMDGYWGLPDERVDGWLRTGDMARADERGFLHLADRKKDMIISGGFNVYPREVEDALAAHT